MGGLLFLQNQRKMEKLRYNRAGGSITVQDVFNASAAANANNGNNTTSTSTSGSTGVFDSIKGEIPGWISSVTGGIANIFAAKNPATVEDNTPKVLAIAGVGVAAVILVIVLVLVLKK